LTEPAAMPREGGDAHETVVVDQLIERALVERRTPPSAEAPQLFESRPNQRVGP
jgi:hypothetical protein